MKAIFTTGEAAEVCKVSQQTIIRCFDSGRLKGFRVPGSRFRRIPRASLIAFMREHGIPIDEVDSGRRRVLVIGADNAIPDTLRDSGEYEVKQAATAYEAGLVTQEFLPDVIILAPMESHGDQLAICRSVRQNPELQHIRIVAAGKFSSSQADQLTKSGCHAVAEINMLPERLASQLSNAMA